MKLRHIFKDKDTRIFRVVDQDADHELDFEIEASDLQIIPDEEGYFIVRGYEVNGRNISPCFMDMHTPERISEIVIKKNILGMAKIVETHQTMVIPAVASDCFGLYELYYAKSNPEVGIQVLREGMQHAANKHIVAEDLGYILRDENRVEEAIEAFLLSEAHGFTTPYTFLELSGLYELQGNLKMKAFYYEKFIEHGGKLINPSKH